MRTLTTHTLPVLLVGPDPDGTPGGMATVLREIRASGVLRDGGVACVDAWTHTEGPGARKIVQAAAGARRILAAPRGAIAHVHMASGWSVERKSAMVRLARARGLRVIVHLHGADLVEDIEGGTAPHRRAFSSAMRAADRVIVLSDFWAAWLRSIEPAARVVVVRNAVPVPAVTAPLPETPTLLFLGRLGERKGIWTLLDAMPEIVRAVPAARFVLAGDGEIEAVRARLDARPDLAARTEIRGWVAPADVPALIDASWALALPSYNEGLPMSVLETMAHGRPVVASRVGGIPDAVRDGADGILIEPGDAGALARALTAVLGRRDTCAAMGVSARERIVEHHEIDGTMAALLALYREVASS